MLATERKIDFYIMHFQYLYICQRIVFSNIIRLLLNIFTLRYKNGFFIYSSKNIKVLLKIQWIFVILLSLFVIRNFMGTCTSVEMLIRYMVRKSLRTPALSALHKQTIL